MMRSLIVVASLAVLSSGTLLAEQASDVPQVKLEAERLPDLNFPRAGHQVFYVGDELTVVGGHTSGFVPTPTAEYLSGGKWNVVHTVYSHDNGMAVVLRQGRKVLIGGGHEKNLGIGQSYEVEMYDQTSHSFDGFGCFDRKRAFASGIELDSGRVLIAGNHRGNDGFEMFDGRKFFTPVKDVAVWHSSPYILRTAPDDVLVFGSVWRNNRFEPCDTVERLNGELFTVPLLREWIPILYDQNSHAVSSRIDDYSYILAAYNADGEVAFIRVTGTDFALLPTASPVPTASQWGGIIYNRVAIADSRVHRAYLVGSDTTGRAYVVSVEYDKTPAPLTLYYTDPLPDLGDTTPVLTPDGNLVITGGITNDNFAPFASVWLLHLQAEPSVANDSPFGLLFPLVLLALVVAVIAVCILFVRRRRRGPAIDAASPEAVPDDRVMMQRICQLMTEERLFLNPELKLSDVADRVGSNRSYISFCINTVEGCSFSSFVNRYRVEYAKQLLLMHPEWKSATIGLESGFSSEQSFFRVFKLSTGMAPKEWILHNSQNGEFDKM